MRGIVAGGGGAGAASAIALARIGADVTVYEAYQDPGGPVGSHVRLAVTGLRALAALDCLEPVQQAGFPVARHRMWSGRGRLLGDVARGRPPHHHLLSVTLVRDDPLSDAPPAAPPPRPRAGVAPLLRPARAAARHRRPGLGVRPLRRRAAARGPAAGR